MSSISVNSVQNTGFTSSASFSQKLTDATKKKLEYLGVDAGSIKTEAQGQAELKIAIQKEMQKAQDTNHSGSEAMIKAQAKDLAYEVGASVPSSQKVGDILTKVSSKITELKQAAGTDETKLSKVYQYQSQYDAIVSSFNNMQTAKTQIATGMDGLANYNKILLGLK